MRECQGCCLVEEGASPLVARYDLVAAAQSLSPSQLATREPKQWRYRELLPVCDARCALTRCEGWIPLVHARSLGTEIGFHNLHVKDESLNPTGSFKARGLSVAISRALELVATVVSTPRRETQPGC
jgi:threonine synthase